MPLRHYYEDYFFLLTAFLAGFLVAHFLVPQAMILASVFRVSGIELFCAYSDFHSVIVQQQRHC